MKLRIAALSPNDWEWVCEQVPILLVEDTSGLVGFDDETGERVCAAVFDNWTNTSVQTHMMLTNPMALRHGFMEFCTDFMFNDQGKKVAYGLVPSDKEKAIKFNNHLGFSEVMRFEDGYDDGIDYIVMEMKQADCKYLPEPNTLKAAEMV